MNLSHAFLLCFLTLGQASDLPDAPSSDPAGSEALTPSPQAQPETPVELEQPTPEPSNPTDQPERPEEHDQPSDQGEPTDPQTPDQPTPQPDEPQNPDVAPTEPEQPQEPADSQQPEKPSQQPEEPAEPEKPAEPQGPAIPRPDILTEEDASNYEKVKAWVRKYLYPDETRFTVYTREDYDKATSLRVVADQFPFFLGELNAEDQCAPESEGCTHREFNNPEKDSKMLNLTKITVSPVRTWGHDQYIYLHFSDGARMWYKQPRYGRLRYRDDLWIKGKSYLGLFGDNGHYVPEGKSYRDYPDELLVTRPRNKTDPEKSNAWEYLNRGRFFKKRVGITLDVVNLLMIYALFLAI